VEIFQSCKSYYEKAAHKGLDYGKDQPEPYDAHRWIVRVVDHSRDFSWFQGVPKGHEKLSRKDLMGYAPLTLPTGLPSFRFIQNGSALAD
jgi:hypothetical protein